MRAAPTRASVVAKTASRVTSGRERKRVGCLFGFIRRNRKVMIVIKDRLQETSLNMKVADDAALWGNENELGWYSRKLSETAGELSLCKFLRLEIYYLTG
jgi:hypothetical protein